MEKSTLFSVKPLRFLLLVLSSFSVPVAAGTEEVPFQVGERLVYDLKWGIVNAGTAVLDVLPVTEIGGEEVYHFALTVRTSPFVDNFYKVRDRMDAFARTDLEGSLLYLVRKEAGKNPRDVTVTFDPAMRVAQYSNFGEAREPVRIFEGTLDPLSTIFSFRKEELVAGERFEVPVTDGKETTMGIAHIGTKEERVRVPAGSFSAISVSPDMRGVGGVFAKGGDLTIWFSADERRLPVRMSGKVSVGSFRAELARVERVQWEEEQVVSAEDGVANL